tara:strand:- start:44 stop:478 length:435 start_codon:yes stop_codon:yes gene_type:complete
MNNMMDNMNQMVYAWKQAKNEDGWARVSHVASLYYRSVPVYYNHMKTMSHLWKKERRNGVVCIQPIDEWKMMCEESSIENRSHHEIVADTLMSSVRLEVLVNRIKDDLTFVHKLPVSKKEMRGCVKDIHRLIEKSVSILKEVKQ